MIRRTTLALLTMMTMAPPAIAVERWETESRLAHVLAKSNKLSEALEKYNEAIKLLEARGDNDRTIIIDLQLNKAEALVDSQRLIQADDLLREVEPLVMASKSQPLEIRYRRRLAKLRQAQKNYSECCKIRAQNQKLIASACGRNSLTYAQELRRLTEIALDGKLWTTYLDAATDMRKLQASCLKENDRQRLGEWLGLSFARSSDLAHAEIAKGNLKEINAYITDFGGYWKDPQFLIHLRVALLVKASKQGQNDLVEQCVNELNRLSAEGRISKESAEQVASAYLLSALPDVYETNVKQETETRLRSAFAVLERSQNTFELSNLLIYIQCKSLCALTIVRQHRAAEAEQMLDQLSPGPALLRSCEMVTGIVQARIAVGQEYHARGDDKSAHRQFETIYKLLDQVSDSAVRRKQLDDLHKQEKKIFG